MSQQSRRGSMIVAALLLFAILLALGMGVLSAQRGRMESARAQSDSIRAKSLALSAWADVRCKLGKDRFFPPNEGGLDYFSYSEDVYDSDGELFGTYTVVLDLRYQSFRRDTNLSIADSLVDIHEGIYLIDCIGKVGGRSENPISERHLHFEVDMTTFNVIRMEDRSSL